MSPTPWPMLLLVTCAACGTRPQAASLPVNQPRPIRQGEDPGRLSVVPLKPAAEGPGRRDVARPSMALDARTHGAASPEVPPLGEDKQGASEKGNELRLRERVQSALARRASLSYTAKHVSVAVKGRDVVLTGDVRTAREKAEVQGIVERVEGVRRVDNQLAVIDQPAPIEPTAR